MKFLVIGLGSMGKRRIRCLKSLGIHDIYGFDIRKDRLVEAKSEYGIIEQDSLNDFRFKNMDGIVISTPPDYHNMYLKIALKYNLPVFVEASVLIEHVAEIIKLNIDNQTFIAPSCTLFFHPAIKRIKEIILSGKFGEVTNFSYHSGQFLPDWHPWEDISTYYVSKRETGGAREIVPFELTWIVDILGLPTQIKGFFSKTSNLQTDIEDTYVASLKFPSFLGSLVVDVTSRNAIRSLILNLERAQILWNWDDRFIKLFNPENNQWKKFTYISGHSASGYNKNISEQMYIQEISAFIDGIEDPKRFPNSMGRDLKVLKLLNDLENNDGGF